MIDIIYFSNVSNNTHRFVEKLNLDTTIRRIPVMEEFSDDILSPYVLITPTYGDRGVPIQVMKFLKQASHRSQLAGVIASGNTNFGADYAKAGYVISKKCRVPLLYTFEILGTGNDVKNIEKGLSNYVIEYDH